MTTKEAWNLVGGLSTPSKMPCYGWSISAHRCKIGGKLRAVNGSVCSNCYASKGRYIFGIVKAALEKRFVAMENDNWVQAMAHLINAKEFGGYFRWFDSGDLQDVKHLEKIVAICRLTPTVKHWLSTKEYKIVQSFLKNDVFPDNLTVRLSGYILDGPPPTKLARDLGVFTSTVATKNYTCKAPSQDNQCLDCRMCWDKTIANVSYHAH